MKLVLVSCCAPCSAGAIKQLVDGAIPDVDDFVVLFFNPNIFPAAEYEKRMAEQIRYCDAQGVKHVELEYDHDAWRAAVRGLETEPERGARCSVCFEYRFRRAATWARENGYDAVASVLGVSRHKDQSQVDRAGDAAITFATPSQATPDSPRPSGGHCAENRNLDSYSRALIPTALTGARKNECFCGWIAGGDGASHRGVAKLHAPRYTQFALQQSRTLKRNMTDAERLLWHYLRGRRDFSFRKQAPIGNYIVDFVCLSKKLIVELDGAQHGDTTGRAHDAARNKFLSEAGYTVLRFWNDQVFNNMDMVLDTIYRYLATPRHVDDMTPPARAVGISTFRAQSELPPPGRGLSPRATGGGPSSSDIKYIPIKWDEALRQQIGRASDFYRQNYCGCEFSIRKV